MIPSIDEDVEQLELWYIVGENAKWYGHSEHSESLIKLNVHLPYNLAIPLLGIYPREIYPIRLYIGLVQSFLMFPLKSVH